MSIIPEDSSPCQSFVCSRGASLESAGRIATVIIADKQLKATDPSAPRQIIALLAEEVITSFSSNLFSGQKKTQENFTEWQFSVSKHAFRSEHTK